MNLHNLGVENLVTRVKPHARDFKDHESILVVAQSKVSDPHQHAHLKSRVENTLRNRLCEVVMGGGGGGGVAARREHE